MKIFLIIFVLIFFSCSMPDRDNSFDPESDNYYDYSSYYYDTLEYKGQIYKTVVIGQKHDGQQTWMAENVRHQPDGVDLWCYDNNYSNCLEYGGLYNWETAKNICPENWRLPTLKEWEKLMRIHSYKASKLKSVESWNNYYYSDSDTYHFSAKPAMYYDFHKEDVDFDRVVYWWALDYGSNEGRYFAYTMFLTNSSENVYRAGRDKNALQSVRCIKVDFSTCGENEVYDPGLQFCEENKIYPLCNGETYDVTKYKCEDDILLDKCGDNFYNSETHFCFSENAEVYPLCNGETYDVTKNKCEDDILLDKCGDGFYNSETEFCFSKDNKVYDKCGGKEYAPDASGTCLNGEFVLNYGSVEYDNYKYKTIEIGTQTWMAENLQTAALNYKCPGDCEIKGRQYNWEIAANICPTGWHLPTLEEWKILENFVGKNDAARKLKSSPNDWTGNNSTLNITNDYGFSAMQTGFFSSSFEGDKKDAAAFWSATAGEESNTVNICYFSDNSNNLEFEIIDVENSWLSVRCIKDN